MNEVFETAHDEKELQHDELQFLKTGDAVN